MSRAAGDLTNQSTTSHGDEVHVPDCCDCHGFCRRAPNSLKYPDSKETGKGSRTDTTYRCHEEAKGRDKENRTATVYVGQWHPDGVAQAYQKDVGLDVVSHGLSSQVSAGKGNIDRDKEHELFERLRVGWECQIPDVKGWPNACRGKVGGKGIETEGGQAQVFSPQRPVQGVGRVGAGYRIVCDMFGVFPISSCVALLLDANKVSWRAQGSEDDVSCPTHDTCRSGRSGRCDGIARQPKGVFPARHIG